jgi:hypothetical protein
MGRISRLKMRILLRRQMQQHPSNSTARPSSMGLRQANEHSLLQQLSPHASTNVCPAQALHLLTQQLL